MQTKTEKRKSVLSRLQDQLKSGVKTGKKSSDKILLTDGDKSRITNEIKVLENRIPKSELS